MKLVLHPKVLSQNHAHIHSTQRVRLHQDPTEAECLLHIAAPCRIAAANDHPRRVDRRVRVAEVDHVQPMASEPPRRRARDARPGGSVEHFDRDPPFGRRHRVGMSPNVLPLLGNEQHRCNGDGGGTRGGDQDALEELPTRLFQNRTVGSRMGQREATRWTSRSAATSFSTPRGSLEYRSASSARRSRANSRPGSR